MKLKHTACAMLALILSTAHTSSYAISYEVIKWDHPTLRQNGAPLPYSQIGGTYLYKDGKRSGPLPKNVRSWIIYRPASGCISAQVATVDTYGMDGARSNVVQVCAR